MEGNEMKRTKKFLANMDRVEYQLWLCSYDKRRKQYTGLTHVTNETLAKRLSPMSERNIQRIITALAESHRLERRYTELYFHKTLRTIKLLGKQPEIKPIWEIERPTLSIPSVTVPSSSVVSLTSIPLDDPAFGLKLNDQLDQYLDSFRIDVRYLDDRGALGGHPKPAIGGHFKTGQ